jgi:hypothetical protein
MLGAEKTLRSALNVMPMIGLPGKRQLSWENQYTRSLTTTGGRTEASSYSTLVSVSTVKRLLVVSTRLTTKAETTRAGPKPRMNS